MQLIFCKIRIKQPDPYARLRTKNLKVGRGAGGMGSDGVGYGAAQWAFSPHCRARRSASVPALFHGHAALKCTIEISTNLQP